jgi:acyl-CoA synthetase (AMP-forming)/AMP-acid ligase II
MMSQLRPNENRFVTCVGCRTGLFFDTLPMTATSKIDKKVIRDKYKDLLR